RGRIKNDSRGLGLLYQWRDSHRIGGENNTAQIVHPVVDKEFLSRRLYSTGVGTATVAVNDLDVVACKLPTLFCEIRLGPIFEKLSVMSKGAGERTDYAYFDSVGDGVARYTCRRKGEDAHAYCFHVVSRVDCVLIYSVRSYERGCDISPTTCCSLCTTSWHVNELNYQLVETPTISLPLLPHFGTVFLTGQGVDKGRRVASSFATCLASYFA